MKIELGDSEIALIREALDGCKVPSFWSNPESPEAIVGRIRTLAKELIRRSTGRCRHDPAWRYVFHIEDSRDLETIASPLIGAVMRGPDAADRINSGSLSRRLFGKVRVRSIAPKK